jgi:hypothetical protein
MKLAIGRTGHFGSRRMKLSAIAVGAVAVVVPISLLFATGADGAATTVPLGTTTSFAVLAGAGITNTGPTTINGDIGTFPTTTITGYGSITENGTNQAGDAVTQQAKTDLTTAFNNASGQGPTSPIVADLGGQTLAAGVYNSASSVGLTGALTLNGGGNANAVFVFQAGSTLTTASASSIVLTNGAQACNVFWEIGSSATLGTGSSFIGTVLAAQSITVTTGVTVDGRVLAENGAVTLDTDTITAPSCAAATATTAAPTTTAVATTTVPAQTAAEKAVLKKKAAAAAAKAKAAKAAATTTTTPSLAKPPVYTPGFTG